MWIPGFMYGGISSTRCTTTQLCDLDKKLDKIISMIEKLDGLKGFGSNVLANVVGDIIMGR